MLNKEECEQALMNICSSNSRIEDRKVFKDLINEHYELVEKHEMLENTYSMLCEDYLNPQPYRFEDFKECDYVYDKKEDEIVLIIGTFENHKTNEKIVRALVFGYKDFIEIPFKDNRFYPVQMANVRCER